MPRMACATERTRRPPRRRVRGAPGRQRSGCRGGSSHQLLGDLDVAITHALRAEPSGHRRVLTVAEFAEALAVFLPEALAETHWWCPQSIHCGREASSIAFTSGTFGESSLGQISAIPRVVFETACWIISQPHDMHFWYANSAVFMSIVNRSPPVYRTCCPGRTPSRPTSSTSGARRTSRGACASRAGFAVRTASSGGGRMRGTRSSQPPQEELDL